MTSERPEGEASIRRRKRRVRVITHAAWLVSLPLFVGLGYFGRELLLSRGVSVLSLADAERLFVPYALFHVAGVWICTFVLRRACITALDGRETRLSSYLLAVINPLVDPASEKDFPELLASLMGAVLGVLLVFSGALWVGVLATGPGGFAEVVTMELAMFPLTLGFLLLLLLL